MSERRKRIALGRIIGIHGLRGWVKIHSDCRPREAIFTYHEFTAERAEQFSQGVSLSLREGRLHSKGLIAHFDGIDERNQAIPLLGSTLSVTRSALAEPENGEYYWVDLIGLQVVNREGETLGEVRELFETGANDVLVVAGKTGELLIPFLTGTYIDTVDFPTRRLHVDWYREWSTRGAKEHSDHDAH